MKDLQQRRSRNCCIHALCRLCDEPLSRVLRKNGNLPVQADQAGFAYRLNKTDIASSDEKFTTKSASLAEQSSPSTVAQFFICNRTTGPLASHPVGELPLSRRVSGEATFRDGWGFSFMPAQ
jgi:hypothetical protein